MGEEKKPTELHPKLLKGRTRRSQDRGPTGSSQRALTDSRGIEQPRGRKSQWGVDLTSKPAVFQVCSCQVSGFSEHHLPRHPFWSSPTGVGQESIVHTQGLKGRTVLTLQGRIRALEGVAQALTWWARTH